MGFFDTIVGFIRQGIDLVKNFATAITGGDKQKKETEAVEGGNVVEQNFDSYIAYITNSAPNERNKYEMQMLFNYLKSRETLVNHAYYRKYKEWLEKPRDETSVLEEGKAPPPSEPLFVCRTKYFVFVVRHTEPSHIEVKEREYTIRAASLSEAERKSKMIIRNKVFEDKTICKEISPNFVIIFDDVDYRSVYENNEMYLKEREAEVESGWSICFGASCVFYAAIDLKRGAQ